MSRWIVTCETSLLAVKVHKMLRGRGWKQTKDSTILGTKNQYWEAEWSNAQNNCTRIQIIGLFWVWRNPRLSGRAIWSMNFHTWKNCCHDWTELNIDNVEFGTWSRPYQPEAFGPSSPSQVFFWVGYQKIYLFFSFFALLPFRAHVQMLLRGSQEGSQNEIEQMLLRAKVQKVNVPLAQSKTPARTGAVRRLVSVSMVRKVARMQSSFAKSATCCNMSNECPTYCCRALPNGAALAACTTYTVQLHSSIKPHNPQNPSWRR